MEFDKFRSSERVAYISELAEIVANKDLRALERYCQRRTYQQVRQNAIEHNVNLDELEELLAAI